MEKFGVVTKKFGNRLTIESSCGSIYTSDGEFNLYDRVLFRVNRYGIIYNLELRERSYNGSKRKHLPKNK